jgi:hypothetical protein
MTTSDKRSSLFREAPVTKEEKALLHLPGHLFKNVISGTFNDVIFSVTRR